MAHKKSWWIAQNIKDSPWQRLWVKKYAWEKVISWNIIIRQRGTKYFPWEWVQIWKDHTIFSVIEWTVYFTEKKQAKFDWRIFKDTIVHVRPLLGVAVKEKASKPKVVKKTEEKIEKIEDKKEALAQEKEIVETDKVVA